MNDNERKSISKWLSLILRHSPETAGLSLDVNGWVSVEELLAQSARKGRRFDRAMLDEVVATNDKQRFAFSDDGLRIRASQGHSVNIDLQLEPCEPPEVLYHGTVPAAIAAILADGLKPMSRQHVHLSADRETADRVGSRRGKPTILVVRSGQMWRDGHRFYRSANGVWLAESVPAGYLEQR
ncbi:RNA 2'-phosphotransferase [Pseudomonas sp. CAN2814]|uniref:RNA 2'-phosphotransferase n=1 Tax=Pseudomonas sp. CAN1 TaxID=3046726 RepID=UPI00264878BA|nr:RNA 2'-phosphotransferase [Pseudomonas sp. CAN1]MDN6860984.1 RNA 2'-phosphotransferase [Pseudomonas sp. CAN1]